MEAFLDHMIFVCFSAAAIGLILGIPCFLFEKLDEKLGGKLSDKVVKLFSEDEGE